MPEIRTIPKYLRPYLFHGLHLNWEGREQATGDCPWCGREGKFGVRVDNGQWRCLVCAEGSQKGGGNIYTFLRLLWEQSRAPDDALRILADDRGLRGVGPLRAWGVARSILTGDWVLPGWNADGALCQLYRYAAPRPGDKRVLMSTPDLGHGLFAPGPPDWGKLRKEVAICEGPWDGMALWEAAGECRRAGDSLVPTANAGASLLGHMDVLAIPGCGSVGEPLLRWAPLLAGRDVSLMFDSDHPRRQPNGGASPPAGHDAMRRSVSLLRGADDKPRSVSYLHWGDAGYDPVLKSGTDVRDLLVAAGADRSARARSLRDLMARMRPAPDDWKAATLVGGHAARLEPVACSDWRTLINAWRKALKWTDGLDRALSAMLAVVVSTRLVGDQLWVKVIGPPATGKSVLCEALSVSQKYIYPTSTLRGFHSGWRSGFGDEDHSLIPNVRDKTLVVKDGDTLLQSPNLTQILSEGRDLYDTTSRARYRTGAGRDYEGVRMTWVLCGTESLRTIDHSELGERFLDVVIMTSIDNDLEDDIGWRKINQVRSLAGMEANCRASSGNAPELVAAMELTGGYVEHLRRNAAALVGAVIMSDDAARLCTRLGKFVSFMRARPSDRHDEHAGREMSTRLISQLGRLALCTAAVLGRSDVDDGVMDRVRGVALDTARGKTMDIVHRIRGQQRDGCTPTEVAFAVHDTDERIRTLLRFLAGIGAVERFFPNLPIAAGGWRRSTSPRWRLAPTMLGLYDLVVGAPAAVGGNGRA